MIYFDNGATSFPKPAAVIGAMEECMLKYCGNPGRSGHYLSMRTGEKVYEARQETASFFNIDKGENLIFTKNTTEALNLAIKGLLKKGDHVITTSMEHNSVLRPLKNLEKQGVILSIVWGNNQGEVNAEDIEKHINPATKLIVTTAASNVCGTIMPLKEIGELAKKKKVLYLVDGAQAAGTIDLDIKANNIDLLAFPGHKGLLGPLGTGGLYISEKVKLEPLIEGGTGTESKSIIHPYDRPEGFEAGTINAPAIIGLGEGIKFIKKVGIKNIRNHEKKLVERLESKLRNMSFVQIYGPETNKKVGITLFNINSLSSEEITAILNHYGICVRGGFHCSGLAHKTIGTWDSGAVRVSFGPFNTAQEVDYLADIIWKIGRGRK